MLSKRRGCSPQPLKQVVNAKVEEYTTLPSIIMVEWKMGVSPILVPFHLGKKIHFHDYERKGSDYTC